MARKKILFIVGSMNQTSQMHQISSYLTEYDAYFTQYYSDNWFVVFLTKMGYLDYTILGGQFRINSEKYLRENGLKIDYMGKQHGQEYELVVTCSDLIMPKNIRTKKTIWVQEGMVDPYTTLSAIIKALQLPRYLSIGTSLNGSSNECDLYCSASEGYSQYFHKKGTDAHKLIVTGIPNFDNLAQHLDNDFPYHGHVLVATSDIRETLRKDDRIGFLKHCNEIAAGRQLIFKLHPNEDFKRATDEIRQICPENALIYTTGNINDMIANCSELITQYSTVVYVGLALGKKVYSYFNVEDLKRQTPWQNGGKSAKFIADICRSYIEFHGNKQDFIRLNRFDFPSFALKKERELAVF